MKPDGVVGSAGRLVLVAASKAARVVHYARTFSTAVRAKVVTL
ncbi:hypothetical protein [Deinococcus pimensis]|nr:hypothetical protein [Deinococcus pimensis]